jgi:Glycosyltransferase family 87
MPQMPELDGLRRTGSAQLFWFLPAIALVFICLHLKYESPTNRWDFRAFYISGKMVANGDAAKLYDLSSQAAYENRYVDSSRIVAEPDSPFLNPSAVSLIFVPLSFLPVTFAYSVWTAINLLLLLATIRALQKELEIEAGDWPLFAALLFAPTAACLLHGQLSLLLLFFYAHAFIQMRRGNMLLAGILIGTVALKFQLMLAFAAILILRRAWAAVAGISCGAMLVAALSAAVSGFQQLLSYPGYIRSMVYHPHVGFISSMVNIRGFIVLLSHREPSILLVAAISLLVVGFAVALWRDTTAGFSLAMIATVLTAYHAYLQDLVLLLLPIAVLLRHWQPRKSVGLVVLLAVSAASHALVALHLNGLFAIASLILFVAISRQSRNITNVNDPLLRAAHKASLVG